MSKRKQPGPRTEITFDNACSLLESVFNERRTQIIEAVGSAEDLGESLSRLRAGMRSHSFATSGERVSLDRVVRSLDARTKKEGFHLLESWDYTAHEFARDILPVLMLDRCAGEGFSTADGAAGAGVTVLLDQYFMAVLGLVTARAWDDGDANENLDRITRLIQSLHGPRGSGRRFTDDAETLLLVAISHYHPGETAYDQLIDKVWTLDDAHQLTLAIACAATMGSHLRWGFQFMYRRDVSRMRQDNVVDYPWLLHAMYTLMRAYQRVRSGEAVGAERATIAEALLNGFAADPWLFTGRLPVNVSRYAAQHAELRDWLGDCRAELIEEFEAHRPEQRVYSPLGFECNFLCNAIVAMVSSAVADPSPHPSLNALFTTEAIDGYSCEMVAAYAMTLTRYAVGNRTSANDAALIVYDRFEARHRFNEALRVLKEQASNPAMNAPPGRG